MNHQFNKLEYIGLLVHTSLRGNGKIIDIKIINDQEIVVVKFEDSIMFYSPDGTTSLNGNEFKEVHNDILRKGHFKEVTYGTYETS